MKSITLSAIVLLMGTFATACHADLVAHWTGDSTAVDATGNGHNGAVSGTTYGTGVFGDAFSFNGINNSVIVPSNTDLEPTEISISMWVQSDLENHIRLLADSTHGAGQSGWALQLNSANNISFAYGNGSGFPEITVASQIGDGQFHHFVATLDGTTMALYVDGMLEGTLGYTNSPAASMRDIQLGNSLALVNRAFEGLMDDVRIFDHALSQSEVSSLFSAASVPEPASAGLLGLAALAMISRRRRR